MPVDAHFVTAVPLADTDEIVGEIVVMSNDGMIPTGIAWAIRE